MTDKEIAEKVRELLHFLDEEETPLVNPIRTNFGGYSVSSRIDPGQLGDYVRVKELCSFGTIFKYDFASGNSIIPMGEEDAEKFIREYQLALTEIIEGYNAKIDKVRSLDF